jgi:hypothetical protein
MNTWKTNWEESKLHYLDWWAHKGLIISMWDLLPKEGVPHADVPEPEEPKDYAERWLSADWRTRKIHRDMSRGCFLADIPPVANTQLGPGSLAGILGAEMEAGEDTIWFHATHDDEDENDIRSALTLDPENKNWKLHKDLLANCVRLADGKYLVGMPDLMEGLDVLASLRGTQNALMDMMEDGDLVEEELHIINDVYFKVFDELCKIIKTDDGMAFCYFSLWGPGTVSKLQSDISAMISVDDFRRFVQPFIREQCARIDHTLYHLDGVDATRHLDALLEIDELDAIQWTPGVQEAQGGDPKWYELYRRILGAGKSVMATWVKPCEVKPLLDATGGKGMSLLVDFKNEREIEQVWKTAEAYR